MTNSTEEEVKMSGMTTEYVEDSLFEADSHSLTGKIIKSRGEKEMLGESIDR